MQRLLALHLMKSRKTCQLLIVLKKQKIVEYGHDVAVLLDSITRLGRAHNVVIPHSGKILSGGVDFNA